MIAKPLPTHRLIPRQTLTRLAGLLILLAPLLLGAVSVPSPVRPTQFWLDPVELSGPTAFAWFPDVITDPSGRVIAAWASTTTLGVGQVYDTVVMAASQDGIRWGTPNDVIATLEQNAYSSASRPALLLDSRGTLHLAYHYIAVHYTQAHLEQLLDARSWRPPVQISATQAAYFSRLAVDHQGVLHLLYTENTPAGNCPLCYRLYYRRSADDGVTWTAPIEISQVVAGAAKPQILVDPQNQIHIVWESGLGGDLGQLNSDTKVLYSVSRDGGHTWDVPAVFTTPTQKAAKNICLGLDGTGRLVTAWLSLPEDRIYSASSTDAGRTWSKSESIAGVWGEFSVYQARTDSMAMATDSAGHIQMVFVGRTSASQKDLSLLNLVWSEKGWSKPLTIATPKETIPEWPRIAIGLGDRLHVVWFERDQENLWNSDYGQYHVWYAQGVADAPHLSPQTYPSPTLTQVTPTSIPAATSTSQPPLPTPTHPQLTPGPEPQSRPDSELDYVILLAKALVPSLGLVLIALVFRQIRRR